MSSPPGRLTALILNQLTQILRPILSIKLTVMLIALHRVVCFLYHQIKGSRAPHGSHSHHFSKSSSAHHHSHGRPHKTPEIDRSITKTLPVPIPHVPNGYAASGLISAESAIISEIRKSKKTTRIWLGTYATQEMAAAAYDVATLALKGSDHALLNSLDRASTYPFPTSPLPPDICQAIAATAALMKPVSSKESVVE
ncbi:Uncharacterized protein Fot_29907 [Forsythia ovata]|uniref:AP2/ERF domain-containing protein n=1 Tax=Forsythia ovata TaxID=205694 RepID=A0ABD1TT89_9LAMI